MPAPRRAPRRAAAVLLLAGLACTVAGCTGEAARGPAAPPDIAPTSAPPHGVSPARALIPAAGRDVTRPGTVLDGLDIRGGVVVSAADVVIRDSRITCADGDFAALYVEAGGSVVLERSELTGPCSAAAVQGQDFVLRGADIHGVPADGIKIDGGNVVVEGSVLRDFAPGPESHADGIQASVPIAQVLIRGNVIDPGPDVNGALFLVAELDNGSAPGPVRIEGNVFGGGGDTVHLGGGSSRVGEVSVIDNVWRRNAAFGPVYPAAGGVAVWRGNRYDDGSPIGPP